MKKRGVWVAQSGKHPTLTQVMISWFMGLSPASGSVLIAESLEPASASVSPSLSAPAQLVLCHSLFLSLSKINKIFFKNLMKKQTTEWKKIFANPITDKQLVSKYIQNS